MSKAVTDILNEVWRQRDVEGYTAEHDDDHDAGELVTAATCYAANAACMLHPLNGTPIENIEEFPVAWPWEASAWKPKDPRRDMVRAAALIIAEIEKLDRVPT